MGAAGVPPPQASHAVQEVCHGILVGLPGSVRVAVQIPGGHRTGGGLHVLTDLPLGVPFLLQVGDVGVVAHGRFVSVDGISLQADGLVALQAVTVYPLS